MRHDRNTFGGQYFSGVTNGKPVRSPQLDLVVYSDASYLG